MHLLSTNHKCTQPYYFPCCSEDNDGVEFFWREVLDFRCPNCFPVDYGVFRCSAFTRVGLVFRDIIYVIIIIYFVIFDYLWILYISVYEINDLEHTYNEYFLFPGLKLVRGLNGHATALPLFGTWINFSYKT
jgi:hypothetical protein